MTAAVQVNHMIMQYISLGCNPNLGARGRQRSPYATSQVAKTSLTPFLSQALEMQLQVARKRLSLARWWKRTTAIASKMKETATDDTTAHRGVTCKAFLTHATSLFGQSSLIWIFPIEYTNTQIHTQIVLFLLQISLIWTFPLPQIIILIFGSVSFVFFWHFSFLD